MNYSKTLSSTLVATSFSFLSTLIIGINQAKAESNACPDISSTTITSINDEGDDTSFFSLTDGEGWCRGTPDVYGVTVFKMGLCSKDPGSPDGTVLTGSAPDFSSCTWTYDNSSGELAEFTSGTTLDLSESFASRPSNGSYPHAVMLISTDFRIKAKYGPVAGITYYTTDEFEVSTESLDEYATSTAPLSSFGQNCTAYIEEEAVSGGTIDAYFLDSSGILMDSNASLSECSGQEKVVGVMNMTSDVEITSSTKGLKMTFVVTNNGTSISYTRGDDELEFDSGPFSVTFETY